MTVEPGELWAILFRVNEALRAPLDSARLRDAAAVLDLLYRFPHHGGLSVRLSLEARAIPEAGSHAPAPVRRSIVRRER
jgi:hypothetical protein